jgi:hypothetical protein
MRLLHTSLTLVLRGCPLPLTHSLRPSHPGVAGILRYDGQHTVESRRIWIGQVSRDIGVRLTDQTWNLTTHKIGPDVDFDRGYLLQDLLMSGLVERYGFVEGVHAAPASAPRTNLTGDPYYTDGFRVVVFLSKQTKPVNEIERLPWGFPPAPSE